MKNVLKKSKDFISEKLKNSFLGNIIHPRIIRRIHAQEVLLKQMIKNSTNLDFQGQVDQDMIAWLYFGGKKDGFYIDIGANDGKSLSNTYIFEKLGWEGVCIEPLPDTFKELRKNRSCDCFNVAISNMSSESIEFIKTIDDRDGDMLSGLSNQMTEAHKKRIEKVKTEKIYVKTLTFDGLMNNYPERQYVDFMSIDVEGGEMGILKTIDFKKYKFGLITVENNEKNKKLAGFMDEQGYEIYLDLGIDIMFIPKK